MKNIAVDHSQRTRALFALAVVCFFWGTTWIASKEAVRHMPALQMAGLRQFLGGMCFIVFFLTRRTAWPKGQEWKNILVLSVLNFMLSNGLSTWGVKYISAGLGAIIGAIFPLWLLIIGLFANKSKLKPKAIIGLTIGFAGVCVIFTEHLHDLLNPYFRFGIFISIVSTWTWAFGTLYTKKHAATFNPYFSLGLQMLISGVTLFSVSHATGNAVTLAAIPWQSWAAIAFLTVFSSIITFVAYIYCLQNLPVEQVSLYAYINPVVAVVLGWLLFEEKLTFIIVAGVLVTLYGVYLVNRSK
ncbi:EamA family transporter [Chitinophagaceae bacterium LB-8]|uniref:EamA family transporter n=1 Tax=Paraflavisolibacter caeni TaxID=2982496 RepID=A0A9X2XXZ9_9BACT|nr:EamA family transporter [Paraflavisolibacter caeni]MCU7551644.1 EamA family transporter [Paraflavisolibacter caeni]